jgi:predicted DNA-binding transcriptional regulator AlpA
VNGNKVLELLGMRPVLTKHDLAMRYQVSVRCIEKWLAEGRLPRPLRIHGPRWRPEDITRWEQRRIAEDNRPARPK